MYEAAFKNIDDTLRKDSGCSSELDYIEQTSWILFLKYLDDYETDKANSALLNGEVYNSILSDEFSWNTWATPKSSDGKLDYNAAQQHLGNVQEIQRTFIEFQEHLYKEAGG